MIEESRVDCSALIDERDATDDEHDLGFVVGASRAFDSVT